MIDIQWKAHRDGPGRGLLTDSGDIYIWPEDEQTHEAKMNNLGLYWDNVTCFYIGLDWDYKRERWVPPGYLSLYELSDEQGEEVLAAMPSIEPPRRWKGKRTAPERVKVLT
jgi:hypothetical protein